MPRRRVALALILKLLLLSSTIKDLKYIFLNNAWVTLVKKAESIFRSFTNISHRVSSGKFLKRKLELHLNKTQFLFFQKQTQNISMNVLAEHGGGGWMVWAYVEATRNKYHNHYINNKLFFVLKCSWAKYLLKQK